MSGHAWRGEEGAGDYADVPGLRKSASLEEVRKHGHVPTPGRYVGAAPQEEDDEPFEDKMKRVVAQLREQQAEGARLDTAIEANLARLGFKMGGYSPGDAPRDRVIDWTLRENVRANLRRLVRRILRKDGYPPDRKEKATRTVLEQAEALSAEWVA